MKKILAILAILLTITSASALTIDTPNCSEVGNPIQVTVLDNGNPVNGAILMYYLEGAAFGPITTDANGNPIQDYTPDSIGILKIIASANGNSAEVKVTIAINCNETGNETCGTSTDSDGDGVIDAWDICQNTPQNFFSWKS
ncbi:MAG: hypothetical protein ACE5KE_11075 [Methanosarcinales archaeon]